MHRNRLSVIFLGLLIVACLSACNEDERIFPGGPDKTADLVVYFKRDATHQQIEDFWNTVLSYRDSNGRQFLRPGVARLSRAEPVEGHEGIAVILYWDTADSERTELRRHIDASPIVFTVLKDIAPINVKTLRG